MAFHHPAKWAMDVFAKLNLPEWTGVLLFVIVSAAQWSLIIYAILRWRQRRIR